jgi:hypothetical protein
MNSRPILLLTILIVAFISLNFSNAQEGGFCTTCLTNNENCCSNGDQEYCSVSECPCFGPGCGPNVTYCEQNSDCPNNLVCWVEVCQPGDQIQCTDQYQCPDGFKCDFGTSLCEPTNNKENHKNDTIRRRNRFVNKFQRN